MSLKIFQLFKILNPPLFFPLDKGGSRGILNKRISICFYFICSKKFIEKLMRVKENIKIDKSLCINFGDIFLSNEHIFHGHLFLITPIILILC